MASQKSMGAWLDAATRLGLRAPSFGPFASRPDEVCISLVAYEEADWIDALLNNALSMTRARIALHLNRASSYNAADIARWNVSRVAVNPHRILVQRGYGSILYAHVMNTWLLARQWPTKCRLVVLQASNMLWLRSGMEQRVASRGYSMDARELHRHTNRTPEVASHLRWPLYRALTTPPPDADSKNNKEPHFPMAYHEGSYFPITSVLAFRDFIMDWLRSRGGPRGQATIGQHLLRVSRFPEETWLQAFVANHDRSYAKALRRGPLWTYTSSQLCWRGKSHFTNRGVVDGIRNRSLKDAAQWFASKVRRGLHDPVTRYVVSLRGER